MQYLSVCSGIEAATVAWEPLGCKPVGFSEIDKFPAAVLRARFPDIPNLGDMTNYKEWDVDSIDVLVGGTPCQSFSVAGLRKGMADPRGNLALVYCRILERLRPRWFVWENVPGVLSSSGGRDFGSFLGAVVELGYGFAYRVLDAQFFGVPQRRRRVFVVGCFGDWRSAAAILFEPESLRRNPAQGRGKKQDVAGTLASRTRGSGGLGTDFDLAGGLQVAKPVIRGGHSNNPLDENLVSCTLPASDGGVSSGMHPVVAFNARQDPDCWDDRTGPVDCDPYTMGVSGTVTAHHARRLTPRECERLQGFPDDWTLIDYRGKPAADGPRYKAIGNSMAVPVMRWIGARILQNP